MDLNEYKKTAVLLREAEKHIASGNPGDNFKMLLISAADAIEILIREVEGFRHGYIKADDPYRALWPNWDD